MQHRRRSNRPRGRSGNSKTKKTIQAWIMLTVAIGCLGAFLVNYAVITKDAEKIDKQFCRTDALPEIVTVLIDHTDRIGAVQKAALETRLWDIANAVEKNGAIRFFSVDDVRAKVLDPDFNLCNPGNAKEVSQWTGNERLARKHYEERFASILKSKLDAVLTANTAAQSPIMEATQSVVVTSFLGEKNNSPKKKLILVSDLLQHTDGTSFSRDGIPDFDDYHKTSHWAAVKADMKGINVEIFFLHRKGDAQTAMLKLFWQQYFLEQGATEVKFTPIEGSDA